MIDSPRNTQMECTVDCLGTGCAALDNVMNNETCRQINGAVWFNGSICVIANVIDEIGCEEVLEMILFLEKE